MLLQAYLLDEIQVGIQNLVRGMVGHHLDEQGDDAFYDQGITLGLELQATVLNIALEPYAALAAIDQVLFVLVFLVQWLLVTTQIDQQLVFVHPIIEVSEFLDDLVL